MVLELETNDKKAKMKGGLGWIRGQEQDMSSARLVMGTIFLVVYISCCNRVYKSN